MQWLKKLSMKSSNAGGRGKHYYLILHSYEVCHNKKTFTDVLIKQADTKVKEFKTILLPVNCFDTEP